MVDENILINIENTTCSVENISLSLARELDKLLSCEQPNYWFSTQYKMGRWDGKVHFFNLKSHRFPTGLLPMVIKYFTENEYIFQYKNSMGSSMIEVSQEEISEATLASGKELRDYQIEAVNAVITNTVGNTNIPFLRGIINIATNGGKTTIASALIRHVLDCFPDNSKYVFLFITHSKEIANQTKKVFEQDLDIPVGFIGDGKWKLEKLTVAIVPTLYSKKKRKTKEYQDLINKTVAVVGDEIHHSSSTSWMEVLNDMVNAKIRIGLTGTVDKTVKLHVMRLFSVTGDILIKVSNNYLIEHGYSAVPECYFVTINYPDVDNMRYYGQDGDEYSLVYQDVYQKGIVTNTYRNFIISQICKKETSNGGQILVLVEHLEQGANIQQIIESEIPDKSVVFLHGTLSSEERQLGLSMLKSKDIDILIATSILDEGIDISNINAVIYARGMKSIRKLLQGIGRGLRKKEDGSTLKFYDFIDDTSEQLLKHSLNRFNTLKTEKFDINLVDIEADLGVTSEVMEHYYSDYDQIYDEIYVDKDSKKGKEDKK